MNDPRRWGDTEVPVPDPAVCSATLDGEAVLYHPSTARSLLLNTSLSTLWSALDGVADVADITARLADEFAAVATELRRDVELGLSLLEAERFVSRPHRP